MLVPPTTGWVGCTDGQLGISHTAGSATLSTRWDVTQSPWRGDDGKVMEHRGGLPPSCASEHPLADSWLSR